MKRAMIALLSLSVFLLGCPKTERVGRDTLQQRAARERMQKALSESADGFYRYLMWQKFKDASSFVAAGEARAEFLVDMRKEPLKVTEFEILQVVLDEEEDDEKGATVYVAMKSVRHSDLVEVDEDYKHRWERDDAGNWFVVYPFTE